MSGSSSIDKVPSDRTLTVLLKGVENVNGSCDITTIIGRIALGQLPIYV
jgi:hypothetical protein